MWRWSAEGSQFWDIVVTCSNNSVLFFVPECDTNWYLYDMWYTELKAKRHPSIHSGAVAGRWGFGWMAGKYQQHTGRPASAHGWGSLCTPVWCKQQTISADLSTFVWPDFGSSQPKSSKGGGGGSCDFKHTIHASAQCCWSWILQFKLPWLIKR